MAFFMAMQKAEQRSKNSDLVVWIHLFDTMLRMVLTSDKTVADLCKEAAESSGLQLRRNKVVLKEVLLGGELSRVMSPSEIVLDVVSK
jgi:hypothetical protein